MSTPQNQQLIHYRVQIDRKGVTRRIQIPSHFNVSKGDLLKVTLGDGPCLILSKAGLEPQDLGVVKRVGSQGRIVLEQELSRPIGLMRSKIAVIVDAIDHLEVWSIPNWEKRLERKHKRPQ